MINDLYDDLRRCRMANFINNLRVDNFCDDETVPENLSLDERLRDLRLNLNTDLKKFFNITNTKDNVDQFFLTIQDSVEKILDLHFEAGMHTGIVFCLDMNFINQSDIFDIDVSKKIKNNESILNNLIDVKKIIAELNKYN